MDPLTCPATASSPRWSSPCLTSVLGIGSTPGRGSVLVPRGGPRDPSGGGSATGRPLGHCDRTIGAVIRPAAARPSSAGLTCRMRTWARSGNERVRRVWQGLPVRSPTADLRARTPGATVSGERRSARARGLARVPGGRVMRQLGEAPGWGGRGRRRTLAGGALSWWRRPVGCRWPRRLVVRWWRWSWERRVRCRSGPSPERSPRVCGVVLPRDMSAGGRVGCWWPPPYRQVVQGPWDRRAWCRSGPLRSGIRGCGVVLLMGASAGV